MSNFIADPIRSLFNRVFKIETIRRIVENSSYLFSATGFSMATGIVQGIFIVRLIGPEGFALIKVIQQFASNANRLTSFKINEMVITYVRRFQEEGEEEKAASVYKLAGVLESSGALLAFALIWLLAPWGAQFFGEDVSTAPLWVLYGAFLLFNFWYEGSQGLLQVFNQFKAIALITALQSITTLSLVIVFFFTGGGLVEILIAYLAGKSVLGIATMFMAFNTARRTWGDGWWRTSLSTLRQERRSLLSFAFSTNFNNTIALIARDNEALWTTSFFGLTQAGYYQIALGVVTLLKLPVMHLGSTIFPEISRDIARKRWAEVKDTLGRGSRLAAAYSLPVILVLILAGEKIMEIAYGPESLPAYPFIIVLTIGHTVDNILFWNRPALLALNRPIFPTTVSFIAMLLKVGAIFLFVPRYDALAFAVILSGYFIFIVSLSALRVVLDLRNIQNKAVAA